MRPTTTLIILTRNEIAGVRGVLSKIPTLKKSECFAVDFHSTDGTAEYLKLHHIPVLQQTKPGRSEAFRLGARHAKGKYLIFFSPDGNEDARDIPKLIRFLDDGADLVIASRFMKGSRNEEDDEWIKPRKWVNQLFTLFVNLCFDGSVTDSINGYRAMKKKSFNLLHMDAEGFAIEFQMTMRALKAGMKIREFPTKEGNRIGGASTSYAIPTGLQFIKVFLREVWIGKTFMK